jgi:hypothetical protein
LSGGAAVRGQTLGRKVAPANKCFAMTKRRGCI